MLPEGTLVKNSGGRYNDELRFMWPLVNEVLINWDPGDVLVAEAPTNPLRYFLPSE